MRHNYIVVEFEDDVYLRLLDSFCLSEFFATVSHHIAMSDITGERMLEIVYQGEHWRYDGWRPNMEFVYYSKSGEEYSITCPQFDH